MKMFALLGSAAVGALLTAAAFYYSDSKKDSENRPVLTTEWDKVFEKSDKVDTRKVVFKNRFGVTLVGDLYIPKNKKDERLPAIAVSGPFGAVKEQVSGLYAQTMA